MLEVNKTYLGNCLEILPRIDDKSVDLVLADPPYNVTNCRYDRDEIPLEPLWKELIRVGKDNAAFVFTSCQPYTSRLILSNSRMFKYEWIWEKTQATGFFNAKKQPLRAHEQIPVFYKKQPTYNPQMTYGHKPVNSYTKYLHTVNKSDVYNKSTKELSGGGETSRYPRSVLRFASDKQTKHLHPLQKPVALFEYLIKTYTNKGDLVLDFCAGSGTTGEAAKKLGRDYILMEIDETNYEIIKNRLCVTEEETA